MSTENLYQQYSSSENKLHSRVWFCKEVWHVISGLDLFFAGSYWPPLGITAKKEVPCKLHHRSIIGERMTQEHLSKVQFLPHILLFQVKGTVWFVAWPVSAAIYNNFPVKSLSAYSHLPLTCFSMQEQGRENSAERNVQGCNVLLVTT